MVVPGEDSRNKQLREIDVLLRGAPIVVRQQGHGGAGVRGGFASAGRKTAGPSPGQGEQMHGATLQPSVPVDLLFDDHVVELEECRRWANSDAGQVAHLENPGGVCERACACGGAYAGDWLATAGAECSAPAETGGRKRSVDFSLRGF